LAPRCIDFEVSASDGAAGLVSGATVVAFDNPRWQTIPTARVQDLSEAEVEADGDGGLLLRLEI
jgi:hypothetical protein